ARLPADREPAGDERPERARAAGRRREGRRGDDLRRRGRHPRRRARGVQAGPGGADARDGRRRLTGRPPGEPSWPAVRLGHDVHDVTAAPTALLLSLVAERGLTEIRNDHWATASSSLPDLGPPLVR